MAVHLITDAMRIHADILVGQALTWVRGHDKRTGREFVQFESSRLKKDGQPIIYRAGANEEGCTCPGYLHRGICCHVLAIAMTKTKKRSSKPMKTYKDLYPEEEDDGYYGNVSAF